MHWFVGNGAHITGIVTIFFAVQLDKSELPKETDSLLIAFVIFHALVHLIMSCVMCKSEHDAIGKSSLLDNAPNSVVWCIIQKRKSFVIVKFK